MQQDQGVGRSAEHCIGTALLLSPLLKQTAIDSVVRGSLAGDEQSYW